ncbi:MAG: M48 family metallopeptidase, partial [Candidatus Omnitrophica bacterium]|nr:M48 family metallopeptidase [Candidatus Omnitrophota bacterium]
MNLYEQINKNNRATWVLVSVFALLFLSIGFGLDYNYGAGYKLPIFTIVAFLFAVISSYSAYMSGDKLILSSTRAKPLDLNDLKQRQWQNVVEEMSIASGIPLPKTYIIDDPDPNAFATGRNPQHSSIVVTKGLLNVLNREEQQAVASHEMSHIKNLDIRLMLMVAVLVGSIALIADWAARGFFYGGRGKRSSSRGRAEGGAALIILAIWLVTIIIAPILSRIIAMAVSRRREYLADASGAELTRNPLALARALEKIESSAEPTRSMNQGMAH